MLKIWLYSFFDNFLECFLEKSRSQQLDVHLVHIDHSSFLAFQANGGLILSDTIGSHFVKKVVTFMPQSLQLSFLLVKLIINLDQYFTSLLNCVLVIKAFTLELSDLVDQTLNVDSSDPVSFTLAIYIYHHDLLLTGKKLNAV